MTIMKRVMTALSKAGEPDLAQELFAHCAELTTLVNKLAELHQRKDGVVREFINCVQAQCEHEAWHHSDVSEIACVRCGHTINSDRAVLWGRRVLDKSYDFRYRGYYVGGVKFRLNREMRQHLGEQLIVKRIEKKETNQQKEIGNVQ